MMSEMGKKRNIKIFSAVIAAIFVFSIAGLAIMQTGNPVNAAPSSNIGVVDTSKIITPDNQDAVEVQKQLQQAEEDMQKQFEQQSANMDDQQKQELFQKMQGELTTKRQELFKGLKDKVDTAVGNVAQTKGLSLVERRSLWRHGYHRSGYERTEPEFECFLQQHQQQSVRSSYETDICGSRCRGSLRLPLGRLVVFQPSGSIRASGSSDAGLCLCRLGTRRHEPSALQRVSPVRTGIQCHGCPISV